MTATAPIPTISLVVRLSALVLGFVCVACNGPAPPAPASPSSPSPAPAAPSAPPPAAPVAAPPPQTSLEKIKAALDAGEIDRTTALRQAVHAALAPRRLDPRFAGPRSRGEHINLLRAVMAAWPTLDAATQAELTPYFTPPLDPGSHWAPPPLDQAATPGAHAFIDAASAPLRVWYAVDGPGGKAEAERRVAAFDRERVWSRAKRILSREPCADGTRGGSPRIDVYLVQSSARDADPELTEQLGSRQGLTTPHAGQWRATCGGSPAFILVRQGLSDVDGDMALAHEVFHAFQFAYPAEGPLLIGGGPDENGWYTESTAEYFADSVYHAAWPLLAGEHSAAWNTRVRYGSIVGPLDIYADRASGHEDQYATFVFWAHQLAVRGMDPRVIESILIGLPAQSAIRQLRAREEFERDFAGFSAALFNLRPFDPLRSDGAPIPRDILSQRIAHVVRSTPERPTAELQLLTVPAVSAHYARIVVTGKQVEPVTRSLVVTFDRLDPALRVRAALETHKRSDDDDLTQPPDYEVTTEDWTRKGTRTLCFDEPPEDVDEIVLVLANAGARPVDGPAIRVERKHEPCPDRRGSLYYHAHARQTIPARDVYGPMTIESSLDLASDWVVTFDGYDPDTREATLSFTATNRWAGGAARHAALKYDDELRHVHGAYACHAGVDDVSQNPAPPGSAAQREAERGGVYSVEGGVITVRLPPDDATPTAEYQIVFTPALVDLTVTSSRSEHETNRAITACGGEYFLHDTILYSSISGLRREERETCEGQTLDERRDEAPPTVTIPVVDEVLRGTYDWREGVIRRDVARPACVFPVASCDSTSPTDGPCEGLEAFGLFVRLPPIVTTGR